MMKTLKEQPIFEDGLPGLFFFFFIFSIEMYNW